MKFAPKLFLTAMIVLALPAMALAQGHPFPLVSVCDVRADNNNDCSADAVGDTVCVQGVVLSWKEFGSRGPGAIWDPVNGCCISIFDIDAAPNYARGDLIEVCGWVGPFAGLDEIVDNPADGAEDPTTVLISSGNTFPCTPISCTDMADASATAEGLESCLVTLCGSFTDVGNFAGNTNYVFTGSDGNTCVVRIDFDTDIVGTPIPVGSVTVKGIFGQFDGFGANICGGYQLMPRDTADITPTTCTVAVDEKAWGQVKDEYRDED